MSEIYKMKSGDACAIKLGENWVVGTVMHVTKVDDNVYYTVLTADPVLKRIGNGTVCRNVKSDYPEKLLTSEEYSTRMLAR